METVGRTSFEDVLPWRQLELLPLRTCYHGNSWTYFLLRCVTMETVGHTSFEDMLPWRQLDLLAWRFCCHGDGLQMKTVPTLWSQRHSDLSIH